MHCVQKFLETTIDTDKAVVENEADDDARLRLITSASANALGHYGWAVPLTFGADDGKAYIASYMFIGGGGIAASLIFTKDKLITDGMARGYTMGSLNGTVHGVSLEFLLNGDKAFDNESSAGLTMLGSLGESFTMLYYAKKDNLSWGKMSIVVAAVYGDQRSALVFLQLRLIATIFICMVFLCLLSLVHLWLVQTT